MDIKNLSLTLYTDEIEACKVFYTEILEGKITFDCGWYVTVSFSGDMHISFISPKKVTSEINAGNVTINMFVANIDEVYAVIKEKVNIACDLANQPWGDRSFRIIDPIGNIIYIYTQDPVADEYKNAIKE